MLNGDVTKQLGTLKLEAAFQSDSPVIGLFGPSGAGKSSIIHMIAGLSKPDRGTIVIGG